MPAPDGRMWITTAEIARMVGKKLLEDERMPQAARDYLLQHKAVALEVMQDAIVALGFRYEFKILRLVEQIKEAADHGAWGPIYVPNTVVDGAPVLTPVGEIVMALRDCYTPDFLDQFDEEGNLLDPDPTGG